MSSAEAMDTSPVRKNPLDTSAERNLGARALADQLVLESLGHVAVPRALANQKVLEDLGHVADPRSQNLGDPGVATVHARPTDACTSPRTRDAWEGSKQTNRHTDIATARPNWPRGLIR